MGQASEMQLWIPAHNNNFQRQTASMSTDRVDMLENPGFPEVGWWVPLIAMLTPQQTEQAPGMLL